MNPTTIVTLKELVSTVAQSTGLTQIKTEQVIRAYQAEILKNIKAGNKVKIYAFGAFTLTHKIARGGVNPKTKEKLLIPAHNSPKLTFASNVRDDMR
jgi:DNA-binding protein HU-beta